MRPLDASPVPDPKLLARYEGPGPRYTSYPTADRFVEAYGPSDHRRGLEKRHETYRTSLGAYVHIPFCQSICYYCACNKIVTRDRTRAVRYLDTLAREIELVRACMTPPCRLEHVHFGGGTPTFLSDQQLAAVIERLRAAFGFAGHPELAIEVDPRTVDAPRLVALREMGFTRISFGVQDFEPRVQQAVHRIHSTESIFRLVATARALEFTSINVDMIYGLPHQTTPSFRRSLETLIDLRPDRIAIYGYAHLPSRFKPQRRIRVEDLPTASERICMLAGAAESLQIAGYVHIGMDHFALPDDALAIACQEGRLQRDFQGYSDSMERDLVGLGVSAISRMGPTYAQNARTIEEYCDRVDRNELPTWRGIELSPEDLLRRSVIMALMCEGRIATSALAMVGYSEDGANDRLPARFQPFIDDGLLSRTGEGFVVTPLGRYFLRPIAMAFDAHLDRAQSERFSKML